MQTQHKKPKSLCFLESVSSTSVFMFFSVHLHPFPPCSSLPFLHLSFSSFWMPSYAPAPPQTPVWNQAHCARASSHSIQTEVLRGVKLTETGAGCSFVALGPMSGAHCYTRTHPTPSPLTEMTSGRATISRLSPANCRTSWGRWWRLHLWSQCCEAGFSPAGWERV